MNNNDDNEQQKKSTWQKRAMERDKSHRIQRAKNKEYVTNYNEIANLPFSTWSKDKRDRSMYERTRFDVLLNALAIHNVGFRQHNSLKPWLFHIQYAGFDVYADLGGTKEIPIWEDTAAIVYAFLKNSKNTTRLAEIYKHYDEEGYWGYANTDDGPEQELKMRKEFYQKSPHLLVAEFFKEKIKSQGGVTRTTFGEDHEWIDYLCTRT